MPAAPPLTSLPLESQHQQLGGKLVPFAGYNMPVQYRSGIIAEHLHTRKQAGLFDVSHMGTIFVRGDTAKMISFLEKMIPVDLAEQPLHSTKYGLLLNEQGGIIDDLLISRIEGGFMLVVNAGGKYEDLNFLLNHKPAEVDLEPKFDDALLALQGPKAADVIARLHPDISSLKFMTMGQFELFDHMCIVSRTGYTGEDGFEMILPPTIVTNVFNWLIAQEEVKTIGLGARDSLRLEAGLCLYGHDLTQATTPIEAGLTWAIGKRRRQQGGFNGSNIILEQLAKGTARKRVGLMPESKAVAREGALIYDESGTEVGIVTSGSHSPTLQKPIAMGYLTTPALSQTGLSVDIRGQRYPIAVHTLPFIPHNYYRG